MVRYVCCSYHISSILRSSLTRALFFGICVEQRRDMSSKIEEEDKDSIMLNFTSINETEVL